MRADQQIHNDASVHPPIYIQLHDDDPEDLIQAEVVGELISPPIKKSEVGNWLQRNYPPGWFSSCNCDRRCSVGLHIHVSLKADADYAKLMDPAFYEFFMERAREFALRFPTGSRIRNFLVSRLGGQNRFCLATLDTQRQIGLLDKPQTGERRDVRRTIINYPYGMHKTIECRVFPMFPSWGQAKEAAFLFIHSVEDFLKAAKPLKMKRILVRLKNKDLGRKEGDPVPKKKMNLGDFGGDENVRHPNQDESPPHDIVEEMRLERRARLERQEQRARQDAAAGLIPVPPPRRVNLNPPGRNPFVINTDSFATTTDFVVPVPDWRAIVRAQSPAILAGVGTDQEAEDGPLEEPVSFRNTRRRG